MAEPTPTEIRKHYADSLKIIDELRGERDMLRTALVGLVGVSTREELEEMELVMRSTPAPAEDKARIIDAVHALLKTGEPT